LHLFYTKIGFLTDYIHEEPAQADENYHAPLAWFKYRGTVAVRMGNRMHVLHEDDPLHHVSTWGLRGGWGDNYNPDSTPDNVNYTRGVLSEDSNDAQSYIVFTSNGVERHNIEVDHDDWPTGFCGDTYTYRVAWCAHFTDGSWRLFPTRFDYPTVTWISITAYSRWWYLQSMGWGGFSGCDDALHIPKAKYYLTKGELNTWVGKPIIIKSVAYYNKNFYFNTAQSTIASVSYNESENRFYIYPADGLALADHWGKGGARDWSQAIIIINDVEPKNNIQIIDSNFKYGDNFRYWGSSLSHAQKNFTRI